MKKDYQFKNEYYGEDWQSWQSLDSCLRSVAEEIAEDHWSQDPSDPGDFEFEVEIRKVGEPSERFTVTAEATVVFYAHDVAE